MEQFDILRFKSISVYPYNSQEHAWFATVSLSKPASDRYQCIVNLRSKSPHVASIKQVMDQEGKLKAALANLGFKDPKNIKFDTYDRAY